MHEGFRRDGAAFCTVGCREPGTTLPAPNEDPESIELGPELLAVSPSSSSDCARSGSRTSCVQRPTVLPLAVSPVSSATLLTQRFLGLLTRDRGRSESTNPAAPRGGAPMDPASIALASLLSRTHWMQTRIDTAPSLTMRPTAHKGQHLLLQK